MTQFAAETMIAAHHTSLTDHRTADAHISRHVDKRIGRFDLPRTFTLRGMDVTRPTTDEYVAISAARQAAWVLSGETELPAWQLTIDGVETGEPTEAVYEAYVKARG